MYSGEIVFQIQQIQSHAVTKRSYRSFCHAAGIDRDHYVSDNRLPQCMHLSAVSLTCSEHCGQDLCNALLQIIIAPAAVKTIPKTQLKRPPSTATCDMPHKPTPKTTMSRPRILDRVRILHLITTIDRKNELYDGRRGFIANGFGLQPAQNTDACNYIS